MKVVPEYFLKRSNARLVRLVFRYEINEKSKQKVEKEDTFAKVYVPLDFQELAEYSSVHVLVTWDNTKRIDKNLLRPILVAIPINKHLVRK